VISVAGGNAWGTWMGDLVPGAVLGRYFGIRTALTTLAAMVAGVATSMYVDRHSNFHGYAWVIAVLLVFGFADVVLYRWVPHPPMRPREEQHSLWDMVRIPLSNAGYRNVIILFGLWNFIAGLVNPYGGFFCLGAKYAGMSMTRSSIYGAIGGGCMVLTSYYWGRMSDRWSPRKVLAICIVFTLPPPFLIAMTTPEHTWPMLVANVFGNIGWGGIFVVMMQYLIGLAPAKERSMYLACQSAVMGVVVALSCLVAGVIVKALGTLEWHIGPYVWRDLHILFILSGVARFLCFIPLRWIPDRPAE
jgi:MFS family permease